MIYNFTHFQFDKRKSWKETFWYTFYILNSTSQSGKSPQSSKLGFRINNTQNGMSHGGKEPKTSSLGTCPARPLAPGSPSFRKWKKNSVFLLLMKRLMKGYCKRLSEISKDKKINKKLFNLFFSLFLDFKRD